MPSNMLCFFFMNLFEKEQLVDMAPLKLEPTWHNKRGGTQAISKRLDQFQVKENLLNENLTLKSAVETRGDSDHRPIYLLIIHPEKKPPAPFKFNPLWLEYEQYKIQIQNPWQPIRIIPNHSAMQPFANNLVREKKISKEWDNKHKASIQKDLK